MLKTETPFSTLQEAIQKLGGLDYIVSNAGWTKFANFKDLSARSLFPSRPQSGSQSQFAIAFDWLSLRDL